MDTPQQSDDENKLIAERRAKLTALRERGPAFPNDFRRTALAGELQRDYEQYDKATLEERDEHFSVAGRLIRNRGAFLLIQDGSGTIQLYLNREQLGEEAVQNIKTWDLGDIVAASGALNRSGKGDLYINMQEGRLLTKALRPLPDKYHGLVDQEMRYRQRYVDLIVNPEVREIFRVRAATVQFIRQFLAERQFVEVETPMLHPIAGGATARPFITHHNALDMEMYLRVAPELYLKRLTVGGFEKVFEINRNFRNEGLSTRHNPEFTMLEAYQAYTDFRGMMELTQSLIQQVAEKALGTLSMERAEGEAIDLSGKWREAKYKDLILEAVGRDDWFEMPKEAKLEKTQAMGIEVDPNLEDFEVTNDVFEKVIEHTLIQPTFVTHIPRELCPLAKITQTDSSTIDVFELCINGQEIAPAYSEQNDPAVQREAFMKQVGEETQELDEDFLIALEHGMPPAGGMGLGIDRLVIFLTSAANIRDTILFPTLRPS